MNISKKESSFDRLDRLWLEIEEWMSFRLKSNIKIKEKEDNSIEIGGYKIKKGDKFELKNELKIKKNQTWQEYSLEIEWAKKIKFEEDDMIIITEIDSEKVLPLSFKVDRKNKTLKKDGQEVILSSSIEKFIELFDEYADLQIDYAKFRLKSDDIVRVIKAEFFPYKEIRECGRKGRNTINIEVLRNWENVCDTLWNPITLEINGTIFAQRFDKITNIEETINSFKKEASELLIDMTT